MNSHAFFGRTLLRRLLRPALLLLPLAVAPPAAALQVRYAYDDAGRLLEADYGGGQTIAYGTDANGNLVTRSASSGAEFMLVYTALAGGGIDGVATQLVALGGSGSAVTAVTNPYYAFVQWSDGLGTAARTDVNVQSNLAVSAEFTATLAAHGTPHWWLAAHYPGSNDFDAAESGNTDGDPFTAGEEYAADTDPTNGASFFQILGVDPGPPVVVTFEPGSSARLYSFQFTEDLMGGVWSNVPGAFPRLGAGGEDAMQDAGGFARPTYRIQVEVP